MEAKIFNFGKGIYSYFTILFICLVIMGADSTNFGNWIMAVFVAVALGYGLYKLWKKSSEDEINTFMGLNWMKTKLGLDFTTYEED